MLFSLKPWRTGFEVLDLRERLKSLTMIFVWKGIFNIVFDGVGVPVALKVPSAWGTQDGRQDVAHRSLLWWHWDDHVILNKSQGSYRELWVK